MSGRRVIWYLILGGLFLAVASQVSAATFLADSALDAVDAAPGDGVCAAVDGSCTLRAAIMESNALAGPDVIELLDLTYRLTIQRSVPDHEEDPEATGDLDILDDLSIRSRSAPAANQPGAASGATIAGLSDPTPWGSRDRVVDIHAAVNVDLTDVTIRDGFILEDGAGIRSAGSLTLIHVTVTENLAGLGFGGGISSTGALNVVDSVISHNMTGDENAAAIDSSGALSIIGSVITENMGEDASGLETSSTDSVNNFGAALILDSTISRNGGEDPGGMLNRGVLYIGNTTISENYGEEGAIINFGELVIFNSTISGNRGDFVGGISNSGSLTLANSTVSDNVLTFGGGPAGIENGGTFRLRNSIIAGNRLAEGAVDGFPDCWGDFLSEGHNIVGDGTSCSIAAQSTDRIGTASDPVDPLLGPLADNGGPTLTHALLPGSPAIDGVPSADCLDTFGDPILVDQRGVERPQGTACDIGAYEFEPGQVVIDIRPWSEVNVINPLNRIIIPVAILGTDSFDVDDVDVTTLAFGPDGAAPAFDLRNPWIYFLSHLDVNRDGKKDLLSSYRTEETGIVFGDTQACLSGETLDGAAFEGCDDITTELPCGLGAELALLLPPFLWLHRRRRSGPSASHPRE